MAKWVVSLRSSSFSSRRTPDHIGNKARNLHHLMALGCRVPYTLVCTWDAYNAYQRQGDVVLPALRQEIMPLLRADQDYAVRSSANIEDSSSRSFAGQFNSQLNVRGIENILKAIRCVWDSAMSETVRPYLVKSGGESEPLQMAVLVQEMVPQVVSGVAFSRNPITGQHEVILEAVRGSGEQLVQAGVTPDRWSQQHGQWIDLPENPPLALETAQTIIQQTQRLAKRTGRGLDLEWVFDGQAVYWVQMREITTIEELPVFSNRLAKEMMPGMIKPLVWSFSIPLKTVVWTRFLNETIGQHPNKSDGVARSFYYRLYFNSTLISWAFQQLGFPGDFLDSVMGVGRIQEKMPPFRPNLRMLSFAPRYIRFILDKVSFARRLDPVLEHLHRQYSAYQNLDLISLNDEEILRQLDSFLAEATDNGYYVAIERMVMAGYGLALNRQLKQSKIDPDTLDLMAGLEETCRYDPTYGLAELNRKFYELPLGVRERILHSSFDEIRSMPEAASVLSEFDAFIDRFGYLCENGNDISTPTWRERPEVIFHLAVAAPASRTAAPSPDGKRTFDKLQLPWWRRTMTGIVYRQARKYRLYREHLTALFVQAHALGRSFFLDIGRRLARQGLLADKEDVFYLYMHEMKEALSKPDPGVDYQSLVIFRKQEMEKYRDITTPVVVYGETAPPLRQTRQARMKGVPASRGYYTGRTKVIRGLEEFSKMEEGAVLVVPYSDVGWTPLFIKAGGIVSESGGVLSHSAIVAREYGIPAVLAVPDATQLDDNCLVTIDGHLGEVILHDHENQTERKV